MNMKSEWERSHHLFNNIVSNALDEVWVVRRLINEGLEKNIDIEYRLYSHLREPLTIKLRANILTQIERYLHDRYSQT
jgi:hypothetical protein